MAANQARQPSPRQPQSLLDTSDNSSTDLSRYLNSPNPTLSGLSETNASVSTDQGKVGWWDLPNKDQLFILAICRLSEPLSNVCLLPYIFYLVRSVLQPLPSPDRPGRDTGAASNARGSGDDVSAQISEYSGLLVAAFPLAQFAVSLPWGLVSDSYGRKISIVIGLFVSSLANAAFGFSKSFGALIFWRTVAGLANGNVGIMRTMTAEIVKERKLQTKAFLLLPLVFNSGMVISLALGGFLAEPATTIPWLFGPDGVFNFGHHPGGVAWALAFPYALPALMNAAVLGVALLLAVFGLRETLSGMENDPDIGRRLGRRFLRWAERLVTRRERADYMILGDEEDFNSALSTPAPGSQFDDKIISPPSTIKQSRPPFRKIWTRDVLTALVAFALLPLHNSAFMHIFPVFLSTPHVDNSHATLVSFAGGLGLKSSTIGLWLSTFGIGGILLQMFIYPRMQARIGTLGVFRISLVIFPFVYALAPYLSLLPDGIVRWTGLGLVICGQIMARTMAIPSTVILLTESAPAKNVLGTVHGGGNMLASLCRAAGPAIGGWVFAWGVHTGIVGAVWWLYLVCVSLAALGWTYCLQRPTPDE